MKIFTVLLFATSLVIATGCGGPEKPASPDEITNFLEENPEVVEATNRANAAEAFDEDEFK